MFQEDPRNNSYKETSKVLEIIDIIIQSSISFSSMGIYIAVFLIFIPFIRSQYDYKLKKLDSKGVSQDLSTSSLTLHSYRSDNSKKRMQVSIQPPISHATISEDRKT